MFLEGTRFTNGFEAVMKQLKSLSLHIITEDPAMHPCPVDDIDRSLVPRSDLPVLHQFFSDELGSQWLDRTQNNLTSLAIYADTYWGCYPCCPLQFSHFPHLKQLAFAKYTFAHGEQLDWFFEHRETLTSLILDDCPIVHQWYVSGPWGNSPLTFDDDTWDPEPRLRNYETRWHAYFDRMTANLPKLTHFAFGKTEHPEHESELAMAKRRHLGASLKQSRYMTFHDGEFREPYSDMEVTDEWEVEEVIRYKHIFFSDEFNDHDEEMEPKYPRCEKEDQRALDDLMKLVRGRARV